MSEVASDSISNADAIAAGYPDAAALLQVLALAALQQVLKAKP